jgi:hypothetical protein
MMPREEPSRAKDTLVQFAIHFVLDTIDRYVAAAALVRQTSKSVAARNELQNISQRRAHSKGR